MEHSGFKITVRGWIAALLSAGLFLFLLFFLPPFGYPVKTIVTIPDGADLLQVSELLEREHVVRFAFIFRMSAILLGGEKTLRAGDYYLPYLDNPTSLAVRMVKGDYEIRTVKVTIPEGFTNKQISYLFDSTRFPFFDQEAFLQLAPQGYMFPDTYFVNANASATSTIRLLRQNFEAKIAPISGEIASSGHSEDEILSMASILEGEVISEIDRKLVAGILWKRLEKNMLLQVDSAPETYTSTGLPAVPINNPGLDSIKAALEPTDSDYLYFLTDKRGVVHYAKTFADHEANIKKYLGK